jgi:hypothetical protein
LILLHCTNNFILTVSISLCSIDAQIHIVPSKTIYFFLFPKLHVSIAGDHYPTFSTNPQCQVKISFIDSQIIIAFYSDRFPQHVEVTCVQNIEILVVKFGGTYSNHWALNSY